MIKFLGLIALAILAYLYLTGQLKSARARMSTSEARAVLGLPRDYDLDAVRAAHRRLVAQVHPDKGGSADLTARVNAARDTLLAALNPPAGGAS